MLVLVLDPASEDFPSDVLLDIVLVLTCYCLLYYYGVVLAAGDICP